MGTVRLFHVVSKAEASKPRVFNVNVQAIGAAWDAHATQYADCPVDLATFKQKVADLNTLQGQAGKRVLGAAGKRDEAIRALAPLVEQLRSYLERRCAESPESATTLVQGMSMYLSATPVRAKEALRLRQGDQPGVVKLYASVALLVIGKGGRYFNWEYSLDGGATWIAVPSTPGSRATISGLPVLKEALFRTCVTLNKTGRGPWTNAVPFLVH